MLNSPVRPEETWYLAAQRENQPYPIITLDQVSLVSFLLRDPRCSASSTRLSSCTG